MERLLRLGSGGLPGVGQVVFIAFQTRNSTSIVSQCGLC